MKLVLLALSGLLVAVLAPTGTVHPAAPHASDARVWPAAAAPQSAALPRQVQAAVLDREFFVGTWETHNVEFGRDVRIVWTARRDSSLDYDFVIDGVAIRGSSGTWDFRDGTLFETWYRPDGSTGSGRASIERLDADSFRLTVIDNGNDAYRGLVRIYKRRPGPQTVELRPIP